MASSTTTTTKKKHNDPEAPKNVKIASVKVEGSKLVVKATWDHVKLVTTTTTTKTKDGKSTSTKSSSSKNASGYEVQWSIKKGKHKSKTAQSNSATYEFPLSHFFPKKDKYDKKDDYHTTFGTHLIEYVQVSVRFKGDSDFKASPFASSSKHTLAAPKLGAIKVEPILSQDGHSVKYSWSAPSGIFTGFHLYHSVISKRPGHPESMSMPVSAMKRADYLSYTRKCNLTVNSYDQYHVHITSVVPYGPQGYGTGSVADHVVAWPAATTLNRVTRTGSGDSTYDTFNVTLQVPPYYSKRADYAKPCWCKGLPTAGWNEPLNPDWVEHDVAWMLAQFSKHFGKAADLTIKTKAGYVNPADDEAIFGRVRMCHDEFTHGEMQSNYRLITCGNPLAPSDVSFDINTKTLSWKGNTQLPGHQTVITVQTGGKSSTLDIIASNPGTNTKVWSGAQSGQTYRFGFRNKVNVPGIGTLWSTCADSADNIVWTDEITMLPAAPTGLAATRRDGKAVLEWDRPSADVEEVEVSWSDNPDAWSSTASPKTFVIDHAASSWIVEDDDFSKGGLWYFMVRFKNSAGYGARCSSVSLDMATTPEIPVISLSKDSIIPGGPLVVGWTYDNEDGSDQERANIEFGEKGDALVGTDLSKEIDTSEFVAGETVAFRVQVKGKSSVMSGFSERAVLSVRRPIAAEFTIPERVTELPIPVEFGDLGDYSSATLRILAGMTYSNYFPDGRMVTYSAGDYMAGYSVDDLLAQMAALESLENNGEPVEGGEGSSTPAPVAISPTFPVMGTYIAELTVSDVDGNIATQTHTFDVAWSHVASQTETCDIEYDADSMTALVTVESEEDWSDLGVIDLYRRTCDGYLLVASGLVPRPDSEEGRYWAQVRDPYAAFAYSESAYRVVKRLPNNSLDWADYEYDSSTRQGIVIDFAGRQLKLRYNNTKSDTWDKAFERTRHLGGSVSGHWGRGTMFDGSYRADARKVEDLETIELARALGDYEGEAYLRTPDGRAYPCNVNVSMDEAQGGRVESISLACQRVDSDSWMGTVLLPEQHLDPEPEPEPGE